MPTVKDLTFSALNFDAKCEYLQEKDKEHNSEAREHISDLITYCRKIKPYIYFYKQQIVSLNQTVHYILKNEIDSILPQFPTNRIEKKGIFTLLISGFIR